MEPAVKEEQGTAAPVLGGTQSPAVACTVCGGATNRMARIDLGDPALPETPWGRIQLPVFWCLACGEWEPDFYDISKPVPQPLAKLAKKSTTAGIEPGEDDLPEKKMTLVPVAAGKKAGRKSKAGGAPAWIQNDDTPECPRCEKSMAFVLQLASDSRTSYADMGMIYCFACPECRIAASLVQSH